VARRFRLVRLLAKCGLIVLIATVALVLPLRWLPPLTSSFMLITWATKKDSAGALRYDWVPRREISRHAATSLVAAEDQKFFEHSGFDFASIEKALQHNQRNGRVKGASTISQQVAKNLWLWPGRSWLRKGLEAWFTVWLELLVPKERILELHLNIAQYGPATFGVAAASRQYFGKSAARLNRHEAARLAAVLPNPVRFKADRPSPWVLRRQQWILRQAARVERSGQISAAAWQGR
jgi:monofunctional glycosyltransferase